MFIAYSRTNKLSPSALDPTTDQTCVQQSYINLHHEQAAFAALIAVTTKKLENLSFETQGVIKDLFNIYLF